MTTMTISNPATVRDRLGDTRRAVAAMRRVPGMSRRGVALDRRLREAQAALTAYEDTLI